VLWFSTLVRILATTLSSQSNFFRQKLDEAQASVLFGVIAKHFFSPET
jgi:hypothetical protein